MKDKISAWLEGNFEERVVNAKKRAHNIYYGIDTDFEDDILRLKVIISKLYDFSIPIYSEYFDNRTIDEMLLEIELLTKAQSTSEETSRDLINDTPGGKEQLAEGLFESEENQNKTGSSAVEDAQKRALQARMNTINKGNDGGGKWVNMPDPMVKTEISDDLIKEAEEFMKTNKGANNVQK